MKKIIFAAMALVAPLTQTTVLADEYHQELEGDNGGSETEEKEGSEESSNN